MKTTVKPQLIYLTIAAFFGLLGYPFTRTTAAPYFNAAFGASKLPWAMIAAAVLAIIVVVTYNQLAKRYRLLPLCISMISGIVVINIFFGFAMRSNPKWLSLVFYAWSDVYILILVEQFWSISNTLFDKQTAKKYYGLFLGSASIGAMLGNAMVAKLAEPVGSHNMIFLSSISLTIFVICIALLYRSITQHAEFKDCFKIEKDLAESSFVGGASLVFKNRYISIIAFLTLATQLYINSSYFLYNTRLAETVDVLDKQSALYGEIFFIIQLVTIFFSAVVTPLLLRFIGVAKTHYSVITTIILLFLASLIYPHLMLFAILFITAKSLDYSTYRAAREMFYIPLHVAEKFQAKSFIDVFFYRFSKALTALLIIVMVDIFHLDTKIFTNILIGSGIFLWLILIVTILRMYNDDKIIKSDR